MPLWSVVIPVYNYRPELRQCLESVCRQRQPGMEIIVADSSLGTGSCSEIPWEKYDCRYVKCNDRSGAAAAWNSAVKLCQGDWIHLLHDDDYVLPGFYEALRPVLDSDAGAAFTGYENIDHDGNVCFQKTHGDNAGIVTNFMETITLGNFLQPPAVVVKRSTYEQVGMYRTDLSYCADWEFYIRAGLHVKWYAEPRMLARWRMHEQGGSAIVPKIKQYQSLRYGLDVLMAYLPSPWQERIDSHARQHWADMAVKEALQASNDEQPTIAVELFQEAMRIRHGEESVQYVRGDTYVEARDCGHRDKNRAC